MRRTTGTTTAYLNLFLPVNYVEESVTFYQVFLFHFLLLKSGPICYNTV